MSVLKPRRSILAIFATFGTPGLGQIYNGQPKKALVAYLLSLSLYPILSKSGLALSLYGLLSIAAMGITLLVCIATDAWRNARRKREYVLKAYNRWWVYSGVLVAHAFIIMPIIEGVLFPYPIKSYKIPAASMQPALDVGDHLIVDLNAYRDSLPERGDIVVFTYPPDSTKDFIKRIIGLPGELVEIRDKKVSINNEMISDPWGNYVEPAISSAVFEERDNFGPVWVPPEKYFVLGDNRDRSYDSRFWGFVDVSEIKGKASYVYWAKDKSRIGMKIL